MTTQTTIMYQVEMYHVDGPFAGQWLPASLGDESLSIHTTRDEAAAEIVQLQMLGQGWDTADYRIEEIEIK